MPCNIIVIITIKELKVQSFHICFPHRPIDAQVVTLWKFYIMFATIILTWPDTEYLYVTRTACDLLIYFFKFIFVMLRMNPGAGM